MRYLPKTIKIEYFLHPLYLKKATVLDKREFGNEKFYLIQFFENTVFIPLWMTDSEYCKSCIVEQKPQCSIQALSDLQNLLVDIAF